MTGANGNVFVAWWEVTTLTARRETAGVNPTRWPWCKPRWQTSASFGRESWVAFDARVWWKSKWLH